MSGRLFWIFTSEYSHCLCVCFLGHVTQHPEALLQRWSSLKYQSSFNIHFKELFSNLKNTVLSHITDCVKF